MSNHHENVLANATSSYLRSAAHQPIRWYEWGPEAFAAAAQQNKPILLDVGAVWCHWCHVMDRESYEDAEVAALINEHFIAMKVDRDERPDVDSRYQAAVQAISGQGGWPLTVFMTPEGKPFFGGTYFPPDEHWGRPSFRRVLLSIAQAFRERHGEVAESAEAVMATLAHAEAFAGRSGEIASRIVDQVVSSALQMFDPQHGGFGSAPKFPHPSTVDLLLYRYAAHPEPQLRDVIVTTLTRMARGGVYDQLAGGFHRYSVDERWVVPHFEKMAYDNSELLKNYVHGWQATGEPLFADVARDIIRWMDEWLSDRERGGFYGSQDADISLSDDGDYFTWSMDEARAVLSEDEFRAASLHYDIGEVGEMHHDASRNVLFVRAEPEEIAVRLGLRREQVEALLASAKQKMYSARLKRPTPFVDKTIYVNWNALCVSAYFEAARVLQHDDARAFALKSLDRLLAEGWDANSGSLQHAIAYQDQKPANNAPPGLLDDYGFTALACLDAWETTAELKYFRAAQSITEAMLARFFDATGGGFHDAVVHEDGALGALIARRKPFQDSPTPSGNSAAAILLLRLHAFTGDVKYRERAEQTLETFAGVAGQYGIFASTYAIAVMMYSAPHTQVAIVGHGEPANRLYAAAIAPLAANKAVLHFKQLPSGHELPPALAETLPAMQSVSKGGSFAVLCANATCRPPITDPDELAAQLASGVAWLGRAP